jgi:alpha-D-xyloside xylohydrolase
MMTKGVYENQRTTAPDQRVFILTRSAYAGQQRYAAATWSGDVATRWEDLRNQIPAGLNFSLAGIPYWTSDIGGFATEPRYEHPTGADLEEWRELYTRWFQFGAFCPLFRSHGQFPLREPFNVAPDDHPAYKSMLACTNLRYRLMPYLYSLAGLVTQKNYTIMRALVMDFSTDRNVLNIGDQYMFGPALLINPVCQYRARSRAVYLPAGTGWYDLSSGAYYAGGQTIRAEAPYGRIPVFVREGSILPCGPAVQYSDQMPDAPIRLFVYPGRDGSFLLYEDENTNYNYEKGLFSTIPISTREKGRVLTIGKRQGQFPGMPATRTFEIVWLGKQKPLDFDLKPDATVKYDGSRQIVRMRRAK